MSQDWCPRSKRVRGFTLIELLIVIAIILILIAIALPNFLEAQVRAKVTKVRGDMKALADAEHMFLLDRKTFTDDMLHYGDVTIHNNLSSPVKYITQYPTDPFFEDRLKNDPTRRYFIGTGNSSVWVWGNRGTTKNFEGCRAIADPEVCRPGDPTYNNMRHPAVADAFIILSKGPDSDDDGGNHAIYPHPIPGLSGPPGSGGLQYAIYSATNGTWSSGDLFKFGGAVPAAYRNLSF